MVSCNSPCGSAVYLGYFVKKAIRAEEAKLQSAAAAAPLTDASNQA